MQENIACIAWLNPVLTVDSGATRLALPVLLACNDTILYVEGDRAITRSSCWTYRAIASIRDWSWIDSETPARADLKRRIT